MTTKLWLDRMVALETEIEEIKDSLVPKASEYYRAMSGREHFHTPVYVLHSTDWVYFYTPIREGEIDFRVPMEFFG